MKLPAIVINLDRRPENWTYMQKEWGTLFDLQRMSAVDAREHNIPPLMACTKSHIEAFKQLVLSPDPYVIIMEDDIYRTAAWDTFWPKITAFLEKNNAEWDFISLDPNMACDEIVFSSYNDFLVRVNRFRNTGFIIWKTSFLKQHLDEFTLLRASMDMVVTHDPRFTKLTPATLLVRQRTDRVSDITGNIRSYYDNMYDKTATMILDYVKSNA
jgi:hypothetical protein